jgi:arylsulfatase A-like enzyme
MNKLHLLLGAAIIPGGLMPAGAPAPAPAHPPKPNIILILADDLGWRDLGCFGSDFYETPNLDRLAREGVRFTSAYSVAANCAPSRSCLLTGRHVPRHGVYTVDSRHRFDRGQVGFGGKVEKGPDWDEHILIPPENAKGIGQIPENIGTAMQRAGYKTAYLGKWHTGWGGPIPVGNYPEDIKGFDLLRLNAPRHYNTKVWQPSGSKSIGAKTYLSDYLAGQALDFMETNRDRSFFLLYADFLVHVPAQAPDGLVEKYKNKPASGQQKDPVYAAMVESLDKSVGRILDKLDALGLRENTLVVFTSDNGGDGRTSNLPLRGVKGQLLEGGIRVPAIVRWPGHAKPGLTSDTPFYGLDFFPTFAALAGSPVGKDNYPLDGDNITALFEGDEAALRERPLFWYMPGYLPGRQAPAAAIRAGNYKLTHYFEDDHIELYDLAKDIGESRELSKTEPDKAAELKARLDAWRKETGAIIPPRNLKYGKV